MEESKIIHIEKNAVKAPFTDVLLPNVCIQTILRSLFGDGSLKKQTGYANVRFQMRYSIIQEEYFDWKVKNLSVISTNSFTLSAQEKLIEFFSDAWNIQARPTAMFSPAKKKELLIDDPQYLPSQKTPDYYRLYLNNTELRNLFALIMPLLQTKSMLKKFALNYVDVNYQQRWITTMKEAMPHFHDAIDELYCNSDNFSIQQCNEINE